MSKVIAVLVCSIALLVTGCANDAVSGTSPEQTRRLTEGQTTTLPSTVPLPSRSAAPTRASNFALIFRERPCGPTDVYVLDTAHSRLVFTALGETTAITIPFQLSPGQTDAIYQNVLAINFFNYPSELRIRDDQIQQMVTPAPTYYLSITNGTKTNSVQWTDDVTEPKHAEVERFRELIRLIEQTIELHPEVHQLPQAKVACA